MRIRTIGATGVAAALLASLATITGASPASACSSMARSLREVAVAAQAIVRAEIVDVERSDGGRRVDLRVDRVLKGDAPDIILGFDGEGGLRGGVCDEGWYGRVGDQAILFLGASDIVGTVYSPRIAGRTPGRLLDRGVQTTSTTVTGIEAEIRRLIPDRGTLLPEALFVVDASRLPETWSTGDALARLIHHEDGNLSVEVRRPGGRRLDRAVIRAGDLGSPGPVLFRLPLTAAPDGAWATRPGRQAFVASDLAASVSDAMAIVRSGDAVLELWTVADTSATGPRLRGAIRPAELPPLALAGRQAGPDELPPTDGPASTVPAAGAPGPILPAVVGLLTLVGALAWWRRRVGAPA